MPWAYFLALIVLACMAYISASRSAFARCLIVQWANWVLGLGFVALSGDTTPWAFNILIDGLAAAIILTRPAARFQSILGGFYLVQVSISCGYGLNEIKDMNDPLVYYAMVSCIGWLQILVLGSWGGADMLKRVVHRYRGMRVAVASPQGDPGLGAS